jgi:hypothetical protein
VLFWEEEEEEEAEAGPGRTISRRQQRLEWRL